MCGILLFCLIARCEATVAFTPSTTGLSLNKPLLNAATTS